MALLPTEASFLEPTDPFLPEALGLLARICGFHKILLSSQGWPASPMKAGQMPRMPGQWASMYEGRVYFVPQSSWGRGGQQGNNIPQVSFLMSCSPGEESKLFLSNQHISSLALKYQVSPLPGYLTTSPLGGTHSLNFKKKNFFF